MHAGAAVTRTQTRDGVTLGVHIRGSAGALVRVIVTVASATGESTTIHMMSADAVRDLARRLVEQADAADQWNQVPHENEIARAKARP